MNIFNSLGSNYNKRFVIKSLFVTGSNRKTEKLKKKLADNYGGKVTFTYKGRQALELALKASSLPKGSTVGLNGFTCYVVYQAIERAGYLPVPIDIAQGSLDYDLDGLKKAVKNSNNLKAVIVQNTLGLVVDMPAIESYCEKNGIMIIEDLAHSMGAVYSDGREVGTVGQLTMLSFSQDKPLDVVAGGAVIDRRKKSKNKVEQPKKRVSLRQRDINAMYPFWTALIRGLYPAGIGRYLHFVLKKIHLLATPMSDNLEGIYQMESSAIRLLFKRWKNKDSELGNRQKISSIYVDKLPKSLQIKPLEKTTNTYLRFPIIVKGRAGLVAYLKSKGIYIGDTWYDAPVAPKRYLPKTNYKTGSCPNSEKLADHIVNLPTHLHVNDKTAELISNEVNTWLKSQ